MEVTKKEILIYKVEGKEFLDKTEAEIYEKQVKKELEYTFFIITHDPDLTEGRGYFKQTVIAVPNNYAVKATALNYCFNRFGSPLEFVMGASPTANWILGEGKRFTTISELDKFKNEKISEGIGIFGKLVDKKIIYLKENGDVL